MSADLCAHCRQTIAAPGFPLYECNRPGCGEPICHYCRFMQYPRLCPPKLALL